MKTLIVALLAALLLGLAWEGTIRAPGTLAACAFFKLGRVRAMAWGFRPGRLYIKIGAG